MVRDLDLRVRAAIAGAVVSIIVVIVLLIRIGGSSVESTQSHQDRQVFGLARSHVFITPGTSVSGMLQVPRGRSSSSVTWEVDGDQLHVTGSGPQVQFVAPMQGGVRMTARATGPHGSLVSHTAFTVVSSVNVAASEVAVRGDVLINGEPAIHGEALASGTRIDATHGEISFRSSASIDGSLGGRTRYGGTLFTVRARGEGTRVVNTVVVDRDTTGTRKLHAEVQHLNNARYVTVQSPDAVAMVKGTGFDVTVSPTGSHVAVQHGVVFTLDTYRYFAQPEELTAGQSTSITAVPLARATDAVSRVMTPAGPAIEALARTNPGVPTPTEAAATTRADHQYAVVGPADVAPEQSVINQILGHEIAKVPAPVVVTGRTGSPTATQPTGTDTATQPTPDTTTSTRSDANGGGSDTSHSTTSTGNATDTTDDGASQPGPPDDRTYMLGDYPRWARCRPTTHVLWNGDYGMDASRLRCVLRTDMQRIVQPSRGYIPQPGWGCYRLHGHWRTGSDWCYPLSQRAIRELGNYELPSGWNDITETPTAITVCSDAHTLVAGRFCHRD